MSSPNEPLSGPQSPETAGPVDESTPDRQTRRDDRTRELLRQTQSERDALAERYGRIVSGEVTRLLAGRVSDVETVLRAAGKAPADFLTEEGTVDSRAVEAFAESFVAANPGFRRGPESVSGGGQHRVTGREIVGVRRTGGWSDLLGASGRRSESGWAPRPSEQD